VGSATRIPARVSTRRTLPRTTRTRLSTGPSADAQHWTRTEGSRLADLCRPPAAAADRTVLRRPAVLCTPTCVNSFCASSGAGGRAILGASPQLWRRRHAANPGRRSAGQDQPSQTRSLLHDQVGADRRAVVIGHVAGPAAQCTSVRSSAIRAPAEMRPFAASAAWLKRKLSGGESRCCD
jgi:hypothetical protein